MKSRGKNSLASGRKPSFVYTGPPGNTNTITHTIAHVEMMSETPCTINYASCHLKRLPARHSGSSHRCIHTSLNSLAYSYHVSFTCWAGELSKVLLILLCVNVRLPLACILIYVYLYSEHSRYRLVGPCQRLVALGAQCWEKVPPMLAAQPVPVCWLGYRHLRMSLSTWQWHSTHSRGERCVHSAVWVAGNMPCELLHDALDGYAAKYRD